MPYNASAAASQTKHTTTMHQRYNLHTALRSVLNSMQSTLSTATIRLHLTVCRRNLRYLNTQQVLPPPPPLKINPAFASNYTDFSLVSRATSGYPAHKHTFFHETQQALGILSRTFAERHLLFDSFLVVRFSYTIINWSSIR